MDVRVRVRVRARACARQRGHLERRAVGAEQPVAPLDKALLVAAQPSYLDDVARDLVIVDDLPRLSRGCEGAGGLRARVGVVGAGAGARER